VEGSEFGKGLTGIKGVKRSELPLSEKAEVLDGAKWFSDMEWSQIENLGAYFDLYEIPPGTDLFREGDLEAYLGLIAGGRVKVQKRGDDGVDREVCTLGTGKTFGEMSVIDTHPRSAGIVTVETLTLLVLTKSNFERLNNEAPNLGVLLLLKISKLLSERLRQTTGRLVDHLEE